MAFQNLADGLLYEIGNTTNTKTKDKEIMNMNIAKETIRLWASPSRHRLIAKSNIKARRFFSIRRGERQELVLTVAITRDGLKVECFESELYTRSTGALFRNCATAEECFATFENYLKYNS
jgi:hypothetical protein